MTASYAGVVALEEREARALPDHGKRRTGEAVARLPVPSSRLVGFLQLNAGELRVFVQVSGLGENIEYGPVLLPAEWIQRVPGRLSVSERSAYEEQHRAGGEGASQHRVSLVRFCLRSRFDRVGVGPRSPPGRGRPGHAARVACHKG